MGKIEVLTEALEPSVAHERVFIEILDRHGEAARRVALDRLPARIGRAYTNEVIVDDPHLAPHHLEIRRQADGRLAVVDLGTVNRLRTARSRKAVDRIDVALEATWRAGRTTFRLRPESFVVPPEQSEQAQVDGARSIWQLIAAFVAMLVVQVGLSAAHTAEALEGWRLAGEGFKTALVIVGYACAWAFVTWLVIRRGRFAAHATLACIGVIIVTAIELPFDWIAFALSSMPIVQIGQGAVFAGFAWLLYRHLGVIGRMTRLTAALIAIASASALYALDAIDDRANHGEDVSKLTYIDTLLPPELRIAPAREPEALFTRMPKLREALERDAMKSR